MKEFKLLIVTSLAGVGGATASVSSNIADYHTQADADTAAEVLKKTIGTRCRLEVVKMYPVQDADKQVNG